MAIGGLYKQLLAGEAGKPGILDNQAQVYDYDDLGHFNSLWCDQEGGSPQLLADLKGHNRIVIFWDGRSDESPKNEDRAARLLKPHLTPLDWALAFSIKLLGATTSLPSLRIHIVDLTGKKHDEWAMCMRHQVLAEMPWVKLHAPLIPKTGKGEPADYRAGYSAIIGAENGLLVQADGKWGLSGERITLADVSRPNARQKLGALAKQWAASLIQSDDHHDLNNVVGPALIGASNTHPLVNAFRSRCEWSALLTVPAAHIHSIPLVRHFPGKLDILIVDDQIDNGWSDIVCNVFGRPISIESAASRSGFKRLDKAGGQGSYECRLFGAASPEYIVRVLQGVDFLRRDYSFRLNERDSGGEILLLDLRLHAVATQAAAHFYSSLIPIAERTSSSASVAWNPIPTAEIEAIRAWLRNPISNVEEHYCAITLLPRLLAIAAPMLPIIIFSSTGRARIKERLKPYRNIFTDLEKPRLLTEPDSITQLLPRLQTSVQQSLEILDFQARVKKVVEVAQAADKGRPKDEQSCHLELFFDESAQGKGNAMTSAAAVFAFPSVDGADKLQNECLDEFEKAESVPSLVWARRKGGGVNNLRKFSELQDDDQKQPERERLGSKDTALAKACASIKDRYFNNVFGPRFVVGCQYKSKRPVTYSSIGATDFIDSTLDMLARFNIEFGLCVLPKFLNLRPVSALLHFDVRSVPWDKNGAHTVDAFGLKTTTQTDGVLMIKTYDENSYYPLVMTALSTWPKSQGIKLTSVRGVQLSRRDITSEEARKRRLIHDIADWVAGSARWYNDMYQKAMEPIFPIDKWYLFKDQSVSAIYHNVLPMLSAVRAFDRGDSGEGLRNLIHSESFHASIWKKTFSHMEEVFFWRCKAPLEQVSGADLHFAIDGWRAVKMAREAELERNSVASPKVLPSKQNGEMTRGGVNSSNPQVNESGGTKSSQAKLSPISAARENVLKTYADFQPERGGVYRVVGVFVEKCISYWAISSPRNPHNLIGYVACHEQEPERWQDALMIADCAPGKRVRDDQYFVFDFVSWLLDPNGDDEMVVKMRETEDAETAFCLPAGVLTTTVKSGLLDPPLGWIVLAGDGKEFFLPQADLPPLEREQIVAVIPDHTSTVVIRREKYVKASVFILKGPSPM